MYPDQLPLDAVTYKGIRYGVGRSGTEFRVLKPQTTSIGGGGTEKRSCQTVAEVVAFNDQENVVSILTTRSPAGRHEFPGREMIANAKFMSPVSRELKNAVRVSEAI
jgi:hypothetical protein